jgi:hypothetical protein
MLKIINTIDSTNAGSTKGWAWSFNPFPAYRASGTDHNAFQAAANGFNADKPSKLIITAKGTPLIINCEPQNDEEIILTHITGGFRGGPEGVQFAKSLHMISQKSSSKHCTPSASLVFKLAPGGIAVYKLSGRYHPYFYIFQHGQDMFQIHSTKEFEAFADLNGWDIENWQKQEIDKIRASSHY